MENGVVGVFPPLLHQSVLGAPRIFDKTIAIAVAVVVDPFQCRQDIRPQFAQKFEIRGPLVVGPGPWLNYRRMQVVTLATYHRVPAIYHWREAAEIGGLMSYGTSITDAYRQAGVYTGRILNGEKAADLPVIQSSKFEFVINLNAARAFGLSFPPGLLAIADEVIE